MRYEEFRGPLDGWTYDEEGLIYITSGYRCTARTLECALWLFQCYSTDARHWLIRSDEAPVATRPVYEARDAKEPERLAGRKEAQRCNHRREPPARVPITQAGCPHQVRRRSVPE